MFQGKYYCNQGLDLFAVDDHDEMVATSIPHSSVVENDRQQAHCIAGSLYICGCTLQLLGIFFSCIDQAFVQFCTTIKLCMIRKAKGVLSSNQ